MTGMPDLRWIANENIPGRRRQTKRTHEKLVTLRRRCAGVLHGRVHLIGREILDVRCKLSVTPSDGTTSSTTLTSVRATAVRTPVASNALSTR